MKRTVKTEWRYATYDVWGNASDGYEVNDGIPQARARGFSVGR